MSITNYVNHLPGVPAVDSPFFDELFDSSDSRYTIAKALRDDGFAVIDFPEPDLDEMIERIKHDLHSVYDWGAWHRDGNADMRIMDAWRQNADVRRIAANEDVRQLLGYIYGREAFPFQTLNFPVGTQQHYHSDAVHFSSIPEKFMCGVWVAFENIGPDQGPLIYYPGSHKWPIYTRQHIGERYTPETGRHQSVFEPLWEHLVEVHGIKPVKFYPRKGQALIWAANLLHGGDVHLDRSMTRWSQVTHYYFNECVYYTPLASNEIEGDLYNRDPVDINSTLIRRFSYSKNKFEPSSSQFHALSLSEFDAQEYLALNPDVAEAGIDAWYHFDNFGRFENRPTKYEKLNVERSENRDRARSRLKLSSIFKRKQRN